MPGPTVLVVDDDRADSEAIIRSLETMNFEAVAASACHEAIERIKDREPDLILLDTIMPESAGYQLYHWLRAQPVAGQVAVILLTTPGMIDAGTARLLLGARNQLAAHAQDWRDSILPARTRRTAAAVAQVANGEHQQLIDPLTNVLNRRGLQTQLQREVARAQRYRVPLSCVMVDVDHFKAINDRYGTPRGDDVLQELAASLVACCRPTDFVARYGGEEFTVLLPHTPLNGALACAERIRKTVAIRCLPGCATVSVGAAELQPDEDGHSLLERADGALYDAKKAGGNCVRDAGE